MTFRELMVLLRLYRAAEPELRSWADRQLPELAETAALTEGTKLFDHRIEQHLSTPSVGMDAIALKCTCGAVVHTTELDATNAFLRHARGE